jgi:type III restriction enzyme
MSKDLQFKFDPNLQYQINAIDSIVDLFDGLGRNETEFAFGDQIVSNLPEFETLSDPWLEANLRDIQRGNGLEQNVGLDVDEGLVIEYAGNETWRYPSFTVEMETGTGKTYVFLRTMYELRKRYGFSKFIIVVPSVAIYEGLIKNFNITRDHFRALYDNEPAVLVEYDGSQLNQMRSFATASFLSMMVITIDSFNKYYNRIFKASEELPGELLPYEYVQKTRPIVILDEPQSTVSSPRAKEAVRALHPLFALRYSATHRESPNLVYRLSPFDAYRKDLVKKIQVIGITERENFNQPFVALQKAERKSGRFKAKVRTYIYEKGRAKETTMTLKPGDDLYDKTNRDEHKDAGYVVEEINLNPDGPYLEFKNGDRLYEGMTIGPTKEAIFRQQIEETIREHMRLQRRLISKGIKVISLFFIDRVANYADKDGIIRVLFNKAFNKLKNNHSHFRGYSPEEVSSGYFAKRSTDDGEEAYDADSNKKADREARKDAYNLIMRDKERLLSFEEDVCFIFAHSALKEGWDNPNVFQICTLNQTVSEMKKRQEIGRGLRIAVDQEGNRVFDDNVNILTVIANESYENYASTLQREYEEDGDAQAPPKPTNAKRTPAKRRDDIYESTDFRAFFRKLFQEAKYSININTEEIIDESVDRLNAQPFPDTVLVVQRGKFIQTKYTFELKEVADDTATIAFHIHDTEGNEREGTYKFENRKRFRKVFDDERLRGFRLANIGRDEDGPFVEFENGVRLIKDAPLEFAREAGQRASQAEHKGAEETYPVINLIDRAAHETNLTRPTLNRIFKRIKPKKKERLFKNPEGFTGTFISQIKNVVAAHVAENIKFTLTGMQRDYDLDELFPSDKEFPQKELVDAGEKGLYDKMQTDSGVEERFVEHQLIPDEDNLSFYLKFPPSFKLDLPKVIGNYNPDWGIVRYTEDGLKLELVRETKGSEDVEALQFPHEKRKIRCAHKLFEKLGIDYRPITDETPQWWLSKTEDIPQGTLNLT